MDILQKTTVIAALAAALFGGFGGFLLVHAPQDAAPRVEKLGFVNIFTVRNGCEKQKAIMDKFEKEIQADGKRISDREEALRKQAREELPLYEKGTLEYETLRTKLQVEEFEIKLQRKALRAKLERENFTIIEEFMDELRKKVGEYAKANGYAAIFLHRPVPRIRDQEDFRAIHNQWVIYRDEALDVTKPIIEAMNKP